MLHSEKSTSDPVRNPAELALVGTAAVAGLVAASQEPQFHGVRQAIEISRGQRDINSFTAVGGIEDFGGVLAATVITSLLIRSLMSRTSR